MTAPATRYTVAKEMPWVILSQIWRREYPKESPRPNSLTLAVKLVVTPVLIVRSVCPTTLLRKTRPSVIDAMVIGLAASTTWVLFASFPKTIAVVVIYTWFRLADIMSQRLMEILVFTVRAQPLFAGIQRSLVLGAINLYEVLACYAILFLAGGGVANGKEHLAIPSDSLYFSVITGLTVGYGDFLPGTPEARRLVISEIATVAVFIVAWFPTLAALLFVPQAAYNVPDASLHQRPNER